MAREYPEAERFHAYAHGFADAVAAHGVRGQCTWDAPAAEPVRAKLRTLIGDFVEAGKRRGTLRRDLAAEDAFALLWTIAALVEAAERGDPAIWQRHVELLLDALAAHASVSWRLRRSSRAVGSLRALHASHRRAPRAGGPRPRP